MQLPFPLSNSCHYGMYPWCQKYCHSWHIAPPLWVIWMSCGTGLCPLSFHPDLKVPHFLTDNGRCDHSWNLQEWFAKEKCSNLSMVVHVQTTRSFDWTFLFFIFSSFMLCHFPWSTLTSISSNLPAWIASLHLLMIKESFFHIYIIQIIVLLTIRFYLLVQRD